VIIHARLTDKLRWEVTDELVIPWERNALQDRIREVLQSSGEGMNADALATALGIPKKTVQNSITLLLKEHPSPIVARGSGRRGDPRHFHAVDFVPPASDETPGLVPGSRVL
jgi:hypothetical protein